MKHRLGGQRSKQNTEATPSDRTARSFDAIVRDLPTRRHVTYGKRGAPKLGGVDATQTTIEQLYAAHRLAEATRDEIEKRITELRRQMGDNAA